MKTDAETVVRRAYHAAEGNVMDVQGFVDLFADDGVINAGQNSYRGEQLSYVVVFLSKLAPNVHRELHRVHVMGNVVAVELSIRGTFSGPYESPAGVIQPTGAKLDVPGADFWYVEDGKIKEFNCHVSVNILLEQMGIQPDLAAAVGRQAVTSAAAQEAKDKAAKEELAKFEGTWRLVSGEADTRTIPQEDIKDTSMVIRGDRATISEGKQTFGDTGQHRRQAKTDRHEEPQWPREGLYRTGYLRAGRRHAPHLSYLERAYQAPGEVRDR